MTAVRISQLRALKCLIEENKDKLFAALKSDLNKHYIESEVSELMLVSSEIDDMLHELSEYMKPVKVATNLLSEPAWSYIYRDPLGVVLIIAPWNYPIQLLLSPLVGAIAGGNCVLLKPSELAKSCSNLMAELIPRYLDQKCIRVVEGGIETSTNILKQKFDLIFFTGSTPVGKIVMSAAAQHLTPVILELGGKSPVIVTADADIALAARRIVWGKFMNCGQTCVAPDYVLVDQGVIF